MSATADAARIGRKLRAMPAAIRKRVDEANAKSGQELVTIAKILIPVDTGASRAAIHARHVAEGTLVDFGPKAKVIEENRPFVNPALKVTRKKHEGRAKRAVKAGVKAAFGG